MTTRQTTDCPRCQARLRRGRPPGSLCDPCQRKGIDIRLALPSSFYADSAIETILAADDFGVFFLAVRTHTGWTQNTLADIVDLTQADISKIERGIWRLRDITIIRRIAHRLHIPPALLGFGTTVAIRDNGQKVSWVHRRDFVQHTAGLVLGIAGAAGLDTDRLLALLPQSEPTSTRHLGDTDVEIIEQLTDAFRREDFAHGSGLVRDAAVSQLRAVLPLLNAQVSPEVQPRLLIATARLAMQTGWMSYQVTQDEAARRLWMIGLELARDTDHPLSSDLSAYLLMDLAVQAVNLGQPDEALSLVRIGQAAGVGRYPVSASTHCHLASIQASACAARGDTAACDRALGQAEEHFTAIDPANRPPWGAFLDEVGLTADQGWVRYTLASVQHDPRAAGLAIPLLRHAVDHLDPAYARLRAAHLADLAGAHALVGDTDTAITIGHQAVDAVAVLHAPRTRNRLHTLNTVLEPLHTSPGVAELRDRLATTAS